MKKISSFAVLLIITLFLCSCNSDSLSDAFDEAKLKSEAEKIIDIVNTKDYEAIRNCFRADLKDGIKEPQLKDGLDSYLTNAGAYVKLSSFTAAGKVSSTTKENFAITVCICEYEHSSLTYTISFDENYNMIGLFVK